MAEASSRLNDLLKKTEVAKDIATLEEIRKEIDDLKKRADKLSKEDEKQMDELKIKVQTLHKEASLNIRKQLDYLMEGISKTKESIKENAINLRDDVALSFMNIETSYEETKKETALLMEEKLTQFGEVAGEKINAAAQFIGAKTKEAINGALDYVASKISMISTNLSALTGAVKTGFNKLKGWIMNPIEKLKALPGQIIAGIGTLLNKVKQAVVWTVKAAYSLVVGAVKYTMLAAVKVLKGAIWLVGKAVQFGFYLMKQAFAFMFKIVSKVFSFVVGVMWGAIKAMGKFLLTFVWESLKVIGKTVLKIGVFIFKMVIQIFTSMLASALGPIILLLGGILLFVLIASGKLKGLWDGVKNFFGFGDDGKLKPDGSLESPKSGFGYWFKKKWEDMKKFFGDVFSGVGTYGRMFYGWLEKIFVGASGFISQLFDKASDLGGKFWQMLKDFGSALSRTIMGENVDDAIERVTKEKAKDKAEQTEIQKQLTILNETVGRDIVKLDAQIAENYKTPAENEEAQKQLGEERKELIEQREALIDVYNRKESEFLKREKYLDARQGRLDTHLGKAEALRLDGKTTMPGIIQNVISSLFGPEFKNKSLSQMLSTWIIGNDNWNWGGIVERQGLLGYMLYYWNIAFDWFNVNIYAPIVDTFADLFDWLTQQFSNVVLKILDVVSTLTNIIFKNVDFLKPYAAEAKGVFTKAKSGMAGIRRSTSGLTTDMRRYADSTRSTARSNARSRVRSAQPDLSFTEQDSAVASQTGLSSDWEQRDLSLVPLPELEIKKLLGARILTHTLLDGRFGSNDVNASIDHAQNILVDLGIDPKSKEGDIGGLPAFMKDMSRVGRIPLEGDAKSLLNAPSLYLPSLNFEADLNRAVASGSIDSFTADSLLALNVKTSNQVTQLQKLVKKWPAEILVDRSLLNPVALLNKTLSGTTPQKYIDNPAGTDYFDAIFKDRTNAEEDGILKMLGKNAFWLAPLGVVLGTLAVLASGGTAAAVVGPALSALVGSAKLGAAITTGTWTYDIAQQLVAEVSSDRENIFGFASGGIIRPPSANGGRMITVAEAGDPEIVVPLNAQGLKYIQEVSERIQPIESSGGVNSSNEGILKAIQEMSGKMSSNNNIKVPMMPALSFKDSDKMDITRLISMGILTK